MTAIQWTDETWNPVIGCRRVSPGCEHCYAETMAGRLARMGQRRYLDVVKVDAAGQPRGRWNGVFRQVPEVLSAPLRWRTPRRVFVNSMSDLFGEGVPDEWIDRVLAVIALSPRHTYQILTKRPDRMANYFTAPDLYGRVLREADKFRVIRPELTAIGISNPATIPMRWLWLGTSVEDQQRADERIPYLLRCPAAVRFLSVEPMLAEIILQGLAPPPLMDSRRYLRGNTGDRRIDWVIVGGESGPGARPCHVEWIRSIVRQCRAAAVPVFVKQLGARPYFHDGTRLSDVQLLRLHNRKGGDPSEWPEDLRVREWPEVTP